MEKFLNIMYDFFAFALPGAFAIASVLLLKTNGEFLYCQVLVLYDFTDVFWIPFLTLVLFGYIIGYIIRPIARSVFLLILSPVFFTKRMLNCKIDETNTNDSKRKKLAKALIKKDRSYEFIQIKELTPKSFQYIEFWDMHLSMAHNLALVSILFLIIQSINLWTGHAIQWTSHTIPNEWNFLILFAIVAIVVFILLRVAYKFAYWWCSDIDAAIKYIAVRGLMGKDKKSPLWYG